MIKTVFIVVIILLLQGCLIGRLKDTRKELCLGKIELFADDKISVNFKQPILYPDDIEDILGEKPSNFSERENKRIYEYRLSRRDDISGAYDMPIEFEFIGINSVYRLEKATAHKRIQYVISEHLIRNFFSKLCDIKIIGNTITFSFDEIPLNDMPDMHAVKALLGEPHSIILNGYIYFYELNSSETAKIQIYYNTMETKPEYIHVTFFRYTLEVDFLQKIAICRIKNLGESLKLGLIIPFTQ